MSDEYDRERDDRYNSASKALRQVRDDLADATEGYWGSWVPLHDAVSLLIEAADGGVLAEFAAMNRAAVPSLIALRKQIPPHFRRPRRRLASRKQKIEDELRASDLTALESGRDDVEYGHHDSLPRGEHVARMKK